MGFLVNIDNGGTFTDVCISSGGKVVHAKAITTPHDLTQCFMEALKRGSRDLYGEEDLARLIRETECLRYSTTSGTNAVVEHKGTPVALLVEAGDEETVYGAIARFGSSDLWKAMVPERPSGIKVGADGAIDGHELTRIINQLLSVGAQRLVVTLKSAQAEQNVKEALLDRYPRHLLGAIPFLISTELVQDTDHARRTATSVVNSYLHPGMEHFLYSAENICKIHHLKRPLLIFRNDGDSARVAKTTAIKTWGSGPRGGLEGTLAYAKLYGDDTLVAMDIGGTTTDVSVVKGKSVPQNAYGEVDELQTSFPLPELQSFGLGGSSIVRVADGKIVIGPESVGAAPGPACFGRGGTNATLTDALLIAGVLDGEQYLGGELKLDVERALQAVKTQVGEHIGKNAQEAASAIIAAFQEEVGAHLAAVIKQAGRDPKQATLVAFGGGGPMIAAGIAGAIGMPRVIVPRFAAVFSAFGIGFSHLAHEYQVPAADAAGAALAAVKAELEVRARRDMYGEGVDPASCRYDYSLWRAVDGKVQESPLVDGKVPADANARLTLKAVHELPSSALVAPGNEQASAAPTAGQTEIRLAAGKPVSVPVVHDKDLQPGHALAGPCLIKGDYLTCLVAAGWRLAVTSNHDVVLEVNK
ncbi:MAG: hydantoinase/oxoprolinase family protein [Gammaproteobacteria bacterium]|nr:hydantoinase/oxoprolinase family protein [Gammaproteobacteria bacterium]MBI5616279.1 hydantoinase/oxoprolinase family protein [Gammaproteobacteria bacterium]